MKITVNFEWLDCVTLRRDSGLPQLHCLQKPRILQFPVSSDEYYRMDPVVCYAVDLRAERGKARTLSLILCHANGDFIAGEIVELYSHHRALGNIGVLRALIKFANGKGLTPDPCAVGISSIPGRAVGGDPTVKPQPVP